MACPFYGASNPELFAIERAAMDRPGRVLAALDEHLPAAGRVIDVGAGDGFTAEALSTSTRTVVAAEPAAGMRRLDRALPWVGAVAQALPIRTGAMSAAFSTWAYFFTGHGWDPTPGLEELHRVVAPGGPLLIVDNIGGDDFADYAGDVDITASIEQWNDLGFDLRPIETVFEFDSIDDARTLLSFYWPDLDLSRVSTSFSYRVGLFSAQSRGPSTPGRPTRATSFFGARKQ